MISKEGKILCRLALERKVLEQAAEEQNRLIAQAYANFAALAKVHSNKHKQILTKMEAIDEVICKTEKFLRKGGDAYCS